MTYQIVIEPRVMHDVRSAAQWIEEQSKSPARAMEWVQNIRAEIETLKINPSRCPVDPDPDFYGSNPIRCAW